MSHRDLHLQRRSHPDQLRHLAKTLREIAEGVEAAKHGQLYGIVIGLETISDELEEEADPPPAPLTPGTALLTHLITSGSKVPPPLPPPRFQTWLKQQIKESDMEQTMTDDMQLRLDALDRAITYHRDRTDNPTPSTVVQSAARFEQYLRNGDQDRATAADRNG